MFFSLEFRGRQPRLSYAPHEVIPQDRMHCGFSEGWRAGRTVHSAIPAPVTSPIPKGLSEHHELGLWLDLMEGKIGWDFTCGSPRECNPGYRVKSKNSRGLTSWVEVV